MNKDEKFNKLIMHLTGVLEKYFDKDITVDDFYESISRAVTKRFDEKLFAHLRNLSMPELNDLKDHLGIIREKNKNKLKQDISSDKIFHV